MVEKRSSRRSYEVKKAYDNPDFLYSNDGRLVRIIAEMMEPHFRFEKYGVDNTIIFFGSARTIALKEAQEKLQKAEETGNLQQVAKAKMAVKMSRYYDDAVEIARLFTQWSKDMGFDYYIVSGGGPGQMEAANRGASLVPDSMNIGLNISLPFEQHPNPYISDELNFDFNYFFIRKFWFSFMAKAMIVFPGGFGTFDEMFEILTLIQTKKMSKTLPIVVYGSEFWKKMVNFDYLVETGMISKEDLDLFVFCDTPQEVFDHLAPELERLWRLRRKGLKV